MEKYSVRHDPKGAARLEVPFRGTRLARHPLYTKGTAFTEEERAERARAPRFSSRARSPASVHARRNG